METDTILLTVGILIGVVAVLTIRYAHLKRGERDEGHIPYPPVAPEEGGFQKPWEVAKIVAGIVVACLIVWPVICHAQTVPADDVAELERLRDELAREREARRAAEADAAEALAIAREATARLEEADDSFVPFLAGSPTQRVPSSESVVYVDQLPPGVAVADTIRFTSDDRRGWLIIVLGNELPSLPLNGQQPFSMAVDLDGVRTTMFVVPPGSTGYVVPDRLSYEVIRLVRFEGSALSSSGLRLAGVKFVRDYHARHPHGRLFTDAGFTRTGGEVDAVKAVLLASAPLFGR